MSCNVGVVFKSTDYICEFTRRLNLQRLNCSFCDVVLVAEGVEFPAHRSILAAATDYFDVMFKINMVEKTQSRILLGGATADALGRILDYLYTGTLCTTEESVIDLIVLSSMLMLFDVTENCWKFFVDTLDPRNCIERKILADSVSPDEVANRVSSFVLENFTKLDTNTITSCPIEILEELFLHPELYVEKELDVLHVFLKWCTQNLSEKEKIAGMLLNAIRFAFVTIEKVHLEGILKNYGILNDSVIYGLVLERIEMEYEASNARLSYKDEEVIVTVGGHSECSVLNTVSAYVPSQDKWFELSAMNHPRRNFGLVAIHDNLFVVGGTMEKAHEHPVPMIERYDVRKDTWEDVDVTSANDLERDHAAVVDFRGNIILAGGSRVNSGEVLSSVVELNPADGEWRNLACLNIAREDHAVVANDSSIYVIGGRNQSGVLDSVEKYEVETETWHTLQPMNTKRQQACAVWFNQKLFVFGGYDGQNVLSSAEVYEPGSESWLSLPDMTVARMKFGLSVFNNHAYVIGGMVGSRGPMVADVEKFNFDDSTWGFVRPMKEAKMEVNCATINTMYKFFK